METSAHIYPGNGPAMIRLCFEIKRSFVAAETRGDARPDLAALIENPRELSDGAVNHCRDVMRKSGEMRPYVCLLSRFMVTMIGLGNIPDTFEDQVAVVGPLRVMLATSPIEAYWLSAEMWAANLTDDMPEAVRDLQVRDRPDRREGMLINTSTRGLFVPRYFDVERHGGEKPLEFIEQTDFFVGGATAMQNLVFRDLFEGASDIQRRAFENLKRSPS